MPNPDMPHEAYQVFGGLLISLEGRTHRLEDVIIEMERRLTALEARQTAYEQALATMRREVAALRRGLSG